MATLDEMTWEQRFWQCWQAFVVTQGERDRAQAQIQSERMKASLAQIALTNLLKEIGREDTDRTKRNVEIVRLYRSGASPSVLSHQFRVSTSRIHQIVKRVE